MGTMIIAPLIFPFQAFPSSAAERILNFAAKLWGARRVGPRRTLLPQCKAKVRPLLRSRELVSLAVLSTTGLGSWGVSSCKLPLCGSLYLSGSETQE